MREGGAFGHDPEHYAGIAAASKKYWENFWPYGKGTFDQG
jgi:hypothetical protein